MSETNGTTASRDFGPTARAALAELADRLIPRAHGMPAASEVDVQGEWLDVVLRARPDLVAPLRGLLSAAAGGDPSGFVDGLRSGDRVGFLVLAEVVAGAYYMTPAVRAALGYPGQVPSDASFEEPADATGGLEQVVAVRGPTYREAS